MATFVPFTPSTTAAFTFQANLAGNPYQVTVYWNIFGLRFYVQVADLSGNIIVYRALVGGGPSFQSTFTWDEGTVTAALAAPHNVPVGQLASIYVSQTGQFDGTWHGLSTGPNSLTFDIETPPSMSNAISGVVNLQPINLVQGYISGAFLTYSEATQQFEF
jgi:hypothetical protein